MQGIQENTDLAKSGSWARHSRFKGPPEQSHAHTYVLSGATSDIQGQKEGAATEPARPAKANLLSRPVQNKFADTCGMFSSLHFPVPHLSPKFKTT